MKQVRRFTLLAVVMVSPPLLSTASCASPLIVAEARTEPEAGPGEDASVGPFEKGNPPGGGAADAADEVSVPLNDPSQDAGGD